MAVKKRNGIKVVRYDTIELIMSELIDIIEKSPDNKPLPKLNSFEFQINKVPEVVKEYNNKKNRLFDIDAIFIQKVCNCLLKVCLLGDDYAYKYYVEDKEYRDNITFYFIHDSHVIQITQFINTDDGNYVSFYSIAIIQKFCYDALLDYPLSTLHNIIGKYIQKKTVMKKFLDKEFI